MDFTITYSMDEDKYVDFYKANWKGLKRARIARIVTIIWDVLALLILIYSLRNGHTNTILITVFCILFLNIFMPYLMTTANAKKTYQANPQIQGAKYSYHFTEEMVEETVRSSVMTASSQLTYDQVRSLIENDAALCLMISEGADAQPSGYYLPKAFMDDEQIAFILGKCS